MILVSWGMSFFAREQRSFRTESMTTCNTAIAHHPMSSCVLTEIFLHFEPCLCGIHSSLLPIPLVCNASADLLGSACRRPRLCTAAMTLMRRGGDSHVLASKLLCIIETLLSAAARRRWDHVQRRRWHSGVAGQRLHRAGGRDDALAGPHLLRELHLACRCHHSHHCTVILVRSQHKPSIWPAD